MNDNTQRDPRFLAIPDTHGHAKGEHKLFLEERPLPLTARMLFLWFYHACRRGYPRFLMVADHMNYLTFEDPAAVNLVRRALKLAQAGDLYGAAETANVEVGHAAVVSEGLRRGMRYSIGAEVDNDPRSRPDAQNIVDAMRPDAMIRSVHFIQITHPVHGEGWHWPFDNPEFQELFDVVGTEATWELYVNTLVDAIERLPGHIVGHFFVPAVFGHWPDDDKLSAYEDRVLEAAAARQMAVEFNTRFLYRDHTQQEQQRYLDANKRFLRKAKERGVGIAVGSDAHSPKDQGGAFDTVLDVLDELEINEIVFPLGGLLRRVALRVERKPEPEPEPVPEPVPEAVKAAAEAKPADAAGGAKPVRKARAAAKSSRAPDTSPERPPQRPETIAGSEPADAPAAERAPAPPAPERKAAEPAPAPAEKPAAQQPPVATDEDAAPAPAAPAAKATRPKKPAAEPSPVAKAVAEAVVKAATSAVKAVLATPKPAAKQPAKPAAKPAAKVAAPAKAAPAKRPPAKAAPKAAPARAASKPVPKKSAPAKRAPAKKSAPARSTAKKAAPKKPAPAKKAAPKKSAPARSTAKKAAPKKAAAKKAPARHAPARKAPAKKTTSKKTATKRR